MDLAIPDTAQGGLCGQNFAISDYAMRQQQFPSAEYAAERAREKAQHIRMMALDSALKAGVGINGVDAVIDAAKKIENYLSGETV